MAARTKPFNESACAFRGESARARDRAVRAGSVRPCANSNSATRAWAAPNSGASRTAFRACRSAPSRSFPDWATNDSVIAAVAVLGSTGLRCSPRTTASIRWREAASGEVLVPRSSPARSGWPAESASWARKRSVGASRGGNRVELTSLNATCKSPVRYA